MDSTSNERTANNAVRHENRVLSDADMNTGELKQGTALSVVQTPDFNAEGAMPYRVGTNGLCAITVTQLAGPAGWYDCARIEWEDRNATVIIPLHQCDYIALI